VSVAKKFQQLRADAFEQKAERQERKARNPLRRTVHHKNVADEYRRRADQLREKVAA
jgi:hypothetical protein